MAFGAVLQCFNMAGFSGHCQCFDQSKSSISNIVLNKLFTFLSFQQFIIIFSWADYSGATYGTEYVFPPWANALGWLMALCSVIWIPVVALYKICREDEGSLVKVKDIFTCFVCAEINYQKLGQHEMTGMLTHHKVIESL